MHACMTTITATRTIRIQGYKERVLSLKQGRYAVLIFSNIPSVTCQANEEAPSRKHHNWSCLHIASEAVHIRNPGLTRAQFRVLGEIQKNV